MSTPVIRLYFCDPCTITAEEYEQIWQEVHAHVWSGDITPGVRVLAQLLREHHGRYTQIRRATQEG